MEIHQVLKWIVNLWIAGITGFGNSVICLQYLYFLEAKFFADTIQISVIETHLRLVGDSAALSIRVK